MYGADADNLNLQILLKNNEENDENTTPPEIIGTCTVPTALETESNKYSSYSFVFSPSKNFDRLGFRINRVSFDAINVSSPRNWLIDNQTDISGLRYTGSGQTQITVSTVGDRIRYNENYGDICALNNLVNQSESKTGWLKFGYQCRPGSLIVVNGEPIRLGRSGIY